jgi:hypothetical protein
MRKINSPLEKPFYFLLLITGCVSDPPRKVPTEPNVDSVKVILVDSISYDLSYEGILPVKDQKIRTTLKLSTPNNRFILTEELLQTSNGALVRSGLFNTERGFEKDEDATLYVLNDDKPTAEQFYFVRETGSDNLLIKLDQERRKIKEHHLVLKRVIE